MIPGKTVYDFHFFNPPFLIEYLYMYLQSIQ